MNINIGDIFEHYKNKNRYEIISLARYSDDPEQIFVIYQALYDCDSFGKNPIWARPLPMFLQIVEFTGQKVPRFKRI